MTEAVASDFCDGLGVGVALALGVEPVVGTTDIGSGGGGRSIQAPTALTNRPTAAAPPIHNASVFAPMAFVSIGCVGFDGAMLDCALGPDESADPSGTAQGAGVWLPAGQGPDGMDGAGGGVTDWLDGGGVLAKCDGGVERTGGGGVERTGGGVVERTGGGGAERTGGGGAEPLRAASSNCWGGFTSVDSLSPTVLTGGGRGGGGHLEGAISTAEYHEMPSSN